MRIARLHQFFHSRLINASMAKLSVKRLTASRVIQSATMNGIRGRLAHSARFIASLFRWMRRLSVRMRVMIKSAAGSLRNGALASRLYQPAVLILPLLVSACASALTPAPLIPPRPPSLPFFVGSTFGPFDDAERAHFALWPKPPLWRVEIDQAADVEAHGASPLLVAVCESDASIDALLPFLASAWGLELGNEPNFGQDASSVNAWYLRTIARLQASGYKGRILTAGVGNLDTDTLGWLQTSIAALPADIIIGWHGYSAWQGQIPALLGVLNGRPHAMTESGSPQTPATEATVATQATKDWQTIYDSGAQTAIWYQTHDLIMQPDSNFGIHAYDGHWRPVEASLIGAIR